MSLEFGDLKSASGWEKLNTYMASKSYVSGYSPTQDDVIIYQKCSQQPDSGKFPHAARWWRHIASYTPSQSSGLKKGTLTAPTSATATSSNATTKAPAKKDDDMDLFGDDDGDAVDMKALAAQKKAEGEATKAKAKKIEKSMLLIDVKPGGSDTNLDEVWKLVKAINMPGLEWKEQIKKVPMAFGLCKLQIGCVIEDALVSTEELCEMIEQVGMTKEKIAERKAKEESDEYDEDEDEDDVDLVQSSEIVSFNKI